MVSAYTHTHPSRRTFQDAWVHRLYVLPPPQDPRLDLFCRNVCLSSNAAFPEDQEKSAGSGAPVSWPEKILTLQDGLLARRIRFLLGCEWLCCGNTSLPLSLYPSCSQLGRGCEIFKFQGQLFKADRGAAEACGTNY